MLNVVGLFTGAGALDLGLEAAGFSIPVVLEVDKDACRTLKSNQNSTRPWSVIEDDIHDTPSREILQRAGLREGETDLLAGGPPCQPFSKSGYWVNGDTKRLDDPRAHTLTAFLRVLRDMQPKTFLLENVSGMAYKRKDEALHFLQRSLTQINSEVGTDYSLAMKTLNCADYGVPQTRERIFLIGSRDGRLFKFPPVTHSDLARENIVDQRALTFGQAGVHLEPWTNAWDAIGDLEGAPGEDGLEIKGRWADLLPSIPEGQNCLYHTDRREGLPLFGWRRRYWSFLLKLAKDRPSWTIQAQPGSSIGPFHWKNRRLSTREMMRLQTISATLFPA